MKPKNVKKSGKQWQKPQVEIMELDKEINIVLTSNPPGDPFSVSKNESIWPEGFNPLKFFK